MPHCHDMKVGEIYACEKCGFEIQVVKACTTCCQDDDCGCDFSCCGEPLRKKS